MFKIQRTLKTVFVLVGMCVLAGITSSQAASLTVSTTADNGFGSLRQAIVDATTNAAANTVEFNIPTSDPGYSVSDYRFTITLLSPLPDLPLAPLTINNNQTHAITVSGNNSFRVFTLVNSAVVTITRLTVSNGFSGSGLGGGIYMGDSATLTLIKSSVRNSTAPGDGGGIYVNDSGTLVLTESTVSGNMAISGAGIYMRDSATLNANRSTISGNTGSGNGGGIYNGTSGTVNAVNSTLDGNSTAGNGGGIYNTATLNLTSNTISSNNAGTRGGGIYNNFTATLNNNLIALNTAPDGGDLLGRGSMGQAYTGSYNLVGNADGSEGLMGAPNRVGTTKSPINALLGPLQFNGGATFTRALLHNSPATDKGNSPGVIVDQRGQVRPVDNLKISNDGGSGADIGAYEIALTPSGTTASISGRILSVQGGRQLPGSTVYLTDVNGNVQTSTVSSFGYYYFFNLPAGETYMIRVYSKTYGFELVAVNLTTDMIVDLVAQP